MTGARRGRPRAEGDRDLSQLINETRVRLGLTSAGMARKLGVAASTLGRNKDASFSPGTREKIVSGLEQLRGGLRASAAQDTEILDELLQYLQNMEMTVRLLSERRRRAGGPG
jgi:hypothetical protein